MLQFEIVRIGAAGQTQARARGYVGITKAYFIETPEIAGSSRTRIAMLNFASIAQAPLAPAGPSDPFLLTYVQCITARPLT
jgi:hypothetical protein